MKASVEPTQKSTRSHREPLEQLRKVTTSHCEPLKSHVRFMFAGGRGPALARSRVTEVRQFHVRDGFCARVHRSVVPFARASTASKPATHPSRLTKTCHTPFCGSRKSRTHPSRHGHCPVDAGPPILCSLAGRDDAVSRALSSTGAVATDVRGVTDRCFFDRRRGCSSGSRGSRRSLQEYQFWMQDKQLTPRPRLCVVL